MSEMTCPVCNAPDSSKHRRRCSQKRADEWVSLLVDEISQGQHRTFGGDPADIHPPTMEKARRQEAAQRTGWSY